MADDSVRSDIAEALRNHLTPEQLQKLMDEVLAITKQGRGWCPNCKKAVMCEIGDARAVVGAMTDLANQAWGRPGEQPKGETGITFVRTVVPPALPEPAVPHVYVERGLGGGTTKTK